MSDIRFNQWLHNSGTGGVSQVDGGHVGIGTTNPEIAVHSGNNKILNVGIVTASTYYGDGSNLSGIVGGGTSLSFNDNIGAYFGNSQDLKIHHDGNHSYIDDQGTGNLRLRSGTIEILNLAGNKTSAIFSSGGGQTLNFNNSSKFTTTNTGVTVTGSVVASGAATLGNGSGLNFGDTSARIRGESGSSGLLRFDTNGGERLRIDSSGKIGINQTSPQALVHIGNYETIQNVQQSTVTQYFIDSTRSLKIARQSAGNVTTNAAWYTVATLALGGFSYRCQVSLGGNFTQDVVDIDIQTAYSTSLNNKYSFQMTGKAACAHNNNRITRARVTTAGLLQVWINNGVDSNTTAKVVLETTCGIYAQNAADNAYPMPIVVDSSSPSIIAHHLLNFGVHAQWTWTINSSHVRSYTRLSGEEFCGTVNAGNGSNQGVNNTFNAPMDGLYHCDFSVASISSTGNNNCLISFYGSMTYDAQNNIQNNQEVYDPRGCGAGTQPQQGSGFSTVFKMAKGDYFTFDFYRPGGGNGYTDGGGQIFDIAVHKIQ